MNVEYVRRAYFPDKPSRLQAIFCCDNLDNIQALKERFNSPSAHVAKVQASQYFKGDMNWLFLGVQNIAGSYLAHKYWSGEATTNPFWEFVIPLPATILEIKVP